MVRYPKKNSPYQPVEPAQINKTGVAPEHKLSAVAAGPAPITPKLKTNDDVQVEQLNAHIRVLEEKLKAIETTVAASQIPNVPVKQSSKPFYSHKRYWLAGLLIILIYPAILGYTRWMHPAYTATMGFFVSPEDIKMPGFEVLVPKEQQDRMISSDLTIGKAWSRAAHWPELIGKQPWVVRPIAWAYQQRITVEKHPSATGFVINVSENRMEKAREFAVAIVNVFKENYLLERVKKLHGALTGLEVQITDVHKRLEKIIDQLSMYKAGEQCIIVSAGVKRNLDRITVDRALELEEDYARLKVQYKSFPWIELKDKKDFDRAIFNGVLYRLTDMELKKYLLGKEEIPDYEGGMQSTKAKIAAMLTAYAGEDAAVDVNVLIKAAFLKTKFDAIDALLNKRYGSLSTFSGRTSEYAGLRAEFDKRYVMMENLQNMKEHIVRLLKMDLSAEIVIDMPVIVVKK